MPHLKKKVSIHDIARHLGVSATSVSFVLNGKAEERKISAELVKRVQEYVIEVGYKPNTVAQSLRTGKSKIIGMLVEDIADPFFSSIARGVEEKLYRLGYKIFHSSTDNKTERAQSLLQIYRERQVDGYIVAPAPGLENDIQQILSEGKPVILFDRYFPGLKTTNVVIDNKGGAYKGTEHLIRNGYKKIGFVTLDSAQVQMNERLQGYEEAIGKKGLYSSVLKVSYDEYKTSPQLITKAIRYYLDSNRSLDAILFATNYLAISGLQAIRELGLKIPRDLGVVGFDDNTHFSLFSPTITAIAQPVSAISSTSVEQLLKALKNDGKTGSVKTIVLDTELIIRESSMKPGKPVPAVKVKAKSHNNK